MIGSRFIRLADSGVELLGIDNLRLLRLPVKDGVVQRFVFVEDGDLILCIQADGYSGVAQGIGGAIGLDLVDRFAKLEGQVFGKRACLLPGQDLIEIILLGK